MATKARRKMSPKQIKHFGTKRQRAALKARRHAPAKKRNPTRKRVVARKRSNPVRRVRAVARKRANPVRRTRPRATPRRRVKRKNPEIVSFLLGNPAKRRTKAVAKKRKRVKATARRSNPAGSRRRKRAVTTKRSRRRSNPAGGALGTPMDWLQGGVGAIAGGVGTRMLPQILLGAGNTGAMGYAANAVAALALGYFAHKFFGRSRVATVAVLAGGFAALLERVISDKTAYGPLLQGTGDYLASDFLTPQRMVDGLNSAQIERPGGGMLVASEGAGSMNNTPGPGAGMGGNLW